jgi:hypothetical protein
VDSLRVNPIGLHQAAGRVADVGGQLTGTTPAQPPGAGESWQSSVAIATTARTGAAADETVLAGRVGTTATKVTVAAATYTRTDTTTASTLTTQVV